MNDSTARCAGPGTACRLVQLETPGPRPVWAILDAAGLRRFTGEITLHCVPTVRAYFNNGEVYYAERDGDRSIGERLVEYGVVTIEQLSAGAVQLGTVTHLGRLFDRVPVLDRDPVEVVLELITGEVLGEIADHTVEGISIASYRHHPSGVWKWHRPPAGAGSVPDTAELPVTEQITITPATLPPPAALTQPARLDVPLTGLQLRHVARSDDVEPTDADHQLVADYEAMLAGEAPEPEPPAAHDSIETIEPSNVGSEPPVRAPFVLEFDLNKVLAQVALENDGLPLPADAGDVDDDVRAAVRAALAEIEAATRPAVTHDLSPAAFEIALTTAPDTAADIEPARTPQAPWLPTGPTHDSHAEHPDATTDDTDDTLDRAEATSPTPATGLRRLIAPRKP